MLNLTRSLSAAAALTLCAGLASAQVSLEWISRFDGPGSGNDTPRAIAVDSQGNIVMGGTARQFSPNITGEFWVAKYSPAGDMIWNARFPVRPLERTGGTVISLHIDADDNIYAGGYVENILTGRDLALAKYTPSGSLIYSSVLDVGTGTDGTLEGVQGTEDVMTGMAVSPDGSRVFLAGYRRNTTFFTDFSYTAAAFDANTGAFLWSDRFDNPGGASNASDQSSGAAVDADGNFYITGNSNNTVSGTNIVTLKYSPTGTRQWVSEITGEGNFGDTASHIVAADDGFVYIAGTIRNLSNDALVVKLNPADGEVVWQRAFDGEVGLSDSGRRVLVDGQSNVYLVGATQVVGSDNDVFVAKYNASGDLQWASIATDPTATNSATDAVLGATGVYVTGTDNVFPTNLFATMDVGTRKFDLSTGAVLWTETYNGPANNADLAQGIALDASRNRVYVVSESLTGSTTTGGAGYDWALLAYQEEGTVPTCPGDFNNDGAVNTGDITDFLSAWFAARGAGQNTGPADFNNDNQVNTADITAFLSAWFDARAGGC